MTRALTRRGPDAEGYFLDNDGGCALGHRRLSIIDLEGGRQPLQTADGRVQAVVNGEIYNFVALRKELRALGHDFVTHSDCETVVHGYRQWGLGVLDRIDGMFALAIWDVAERRLVLARDRMGQKPLYYAFVGNKELIFGSELKALAAHPQLERELDPVAMASYLAYECFPEDEAIYRQARKVLPGSAVVYDRESGKTEHRTFWSMQFDPRPDSVPDLNRWTERQIAAEVRSRIIDATRDRLVSDVPLGVFLSGGIDSSTIAAAMAQLRPAKDIKTFSIAFDDPSFDESSHARLVSKHLGTDHREERLSARVMLDILPEVADYMCEPIGDASIIPTYLLSKFTRKTVTVALGGDGGDELFLGYPTFQADRVARQLDRVLGTSQQGLLGRAMTGAAGLLPVSHSNFSLDFKIKRFAQGLGYSPDLRHQAWMGSFMPSEMQDLLTDEFRAKALARDPYALTTALNERLSFREPADALSYQYARLYLAGCVLVKVDRASMAHGLEVRAPLLDTRLVELACAIPGKLKVNGFTTKYILKKAVRPWLPNEIIDRPKKGFGIPIGQWLRGPLRDMAYDLLTSQRAKRAGVFSLEAVARLLNDHDGGIADNRKPLWTLLAFALWNDRYGPGTSASDTDDTPLPPRSTHVVHRS